MFYSTEILSLKNNSTIGVIWLAATLGPKSQTKKLTKRDYANVDISSACRFICAPPEPLSLRLQSNLMIGVTRVYGQQMSFQYGDVSHLWQRIAKGDANEGKREKALVGTNLTIPLAEHLPDVPTLDWDQLLTQVPLATRQPSLEARRAGSSISDGYSGNAGGFDAAPFVDLDLGSFDIHNDVSVPSAPIEDIFQGNHLRTPGLEADAVPRTATPKGRKRPSAAVFFDEQIVLSRREMFLEDELPLVVAKRSKALTAAEARALLSVRLFHEEQEDVPQGDHDSPHYNEPLEVVRGVDSDSTTMVGGHPWSSLSDGRRSMRTSTTHNDEPPPLVPTSSPLKWRESIDFVRSVATKEEAVLQSMCRDRRSAARAFYNLLGTRGASNVPLSRVDAATKGFVHRVKQERPFGTICFRVVSTETHH